MYDAEFIENCFNNLVNSFNVQNSYEFLSSIFLANSEAVSYIGSLGKLVYTVGDTSEIYTHSERCFIEKIENVIVFAPFAIEGRKSSVLCNIIAADLSDFSDLIYNGIAFMKICNKALDGFNIYLLVADDAIHIGQDDLESFNFLDCKISYPIKSDIDWEILQDTFLYLDTKNFQCFYNSLSEAITSIDSCYGDPVCLEDGRYYFTEENDEYVFVIYDSYNMSSDKKTREESIRDFDDDVLSSKRDLSYIKTNKVNSLELLIDAEAAEENASTEETTPSNNSGNENQTLISESMLDDPEALIKFLKKKNKQGK